jgi:hypothetical protein
MRIAVAVSTFVPKAHTPFQWDAQLTLDEVLRRQEVLRHSMPRRGVELHWHDAEVSALEGALARGGREVADVIEAAWRDGAAFDAWTEEFDYARWQRAFEAAGVDPLALAAGRDIGAALPWDHISSGVSRAFLAADRRRADAGEDAFRTEQCGSPDQLEEVIGRLGIYDFDAGDIQNDEFRFADNDFGEQPFHDFRGPPGVDCSDYRQRQDVVPELEDRGGKLVNRERLTLDQIHLRPQVLDRVVEELAQVGQQFIGRAQHVVAHLHVQIALPHFSESLETLGDDQGDIHGALMKILFQLLGLSESKLVLLQFSFQCRNIHFCVSVSSHIEHLP